MPSRLGYIDALRGFAILGVILTHAAQLAEVSGRPRMITDAAGYGVQLFFVISAFTIFLTFARSAATETSPVRNFFIKRVMRIMPVYWLGIVLYTAVYGLASRGWLDGPEVWHYPLHITLTNLLLPTTTSSVVPGGWSISCEMIFYFTVPLWFVLIRSLRAALVLVVASVILGPLIVAGLKPLIDPLLGVIEPGDLQQYWYRSFPSQLGCFAFGIVMFYLIRADHHLLARLRTTTWNLGLLCLAALVLAVAAFRPIILQHHYLFSLGFMMLGVALSQMPWRLLVNRSTEFVGKVSYSSYLIHFLVIKQASLLIPRNGMSPSLYCIIIFAIGLAVTLPLAYLSYRWIEKPLARLAKSWIVSLEQKTAGAAVGRVARTAR